MGLVCILIFPTVFPVCSSLHLAWDRMDTNHGLVDCCVVNIFSEDLYKSRDWMIRKTCKAIKEARNCEPGHLR